MKIAPPRNEELVAPLHVGVFEQKSTKSVFLACLRCYERLRFRSVQGRISIAGRP